MSMESLLSSLKQRMTPETTRMVVKAFRNEPLAWKALEDDALQEKWFQFAGDDLSRWQVGYLGLIGYDESLAAKIVKDAAAEPDEETRARSLQTLETVRLTGLRPGALNEATALALVLRDTLLQPNTARKALATMAGSKQQYPLWRSSFACLPALLPDFTKSMQTLVQALQEDEIPQVTSLILHAVECMPADENDRFRKLLDIFQGASQETHVALLAALEGEEDDAFRQLLANSFLAARLEDADDSQSPEETNEKIDPALVLSYQNQAALRQSAGQTDKASGSLEKAFDALNATHAVALHGLALELEKINPDQARRTWEQILDFAPENDAYRSEYAEFLLNIGETDYALDLVRLLKDPDYAAALALRYPEIRDQLPETEQTVESLIKPGKLGYKSRFAQDDDYFLGAQLAFEKKDFKTASSLVEKALREQPNDIRLLKLTGQIRRHSADLKKAIDSASLIAVLEPENTANRKELANLHLQNNEPQKALAIYQELISAGEHASRDELLTYSDLAIKAGQADLAIPIARNFLATDNLDGEALVLLCKAHIAQGDKKTAIELLEKASALAPERPASWLSLAEMWTSMGESYMALDSLKKAKAALPENTEILTALGKLYLQNDHATEAIGALKQAFQLDPANPEVRKLLSKAFLSHGYVDEAWSLISPLEGEYTGDPDLALVLGETMSALGDQQAARPVLKFAWQAGQTETALKSYTNLLLQHSKQGHSLSSQDKLDLTDLLPVFEANTDETNFLVRKLHADVKYAVGQAESAYQDYLQLIGLPEAQIPREYHHLQLQTGRAAMRLGLVDESLAALQEAILADPDNLEARHTLSEAYALAGLDEESKVAAQTALQLDPTNLENVIWYSDFAASHGQEVAAQQVLKDAIQLRPEERMLYLSLARQYVNSHEMELAKDTLNRMLEVGNVSTEEYVNVANLYLHMDDAPEASSVIRQAISRNPAPDFEESRDLAYSVLRLGDAPAALKLLDESDESIKNHPCQPLLHADVLTANRQFIEALELLEPLLHQAEFANENLCPENEKGAEIQFDVLPYTSAGVLHRAAELERVVGDLAAAKKHSELAAGKEPERPVHRQLQAEIALSMGNHAWLNELFDQVDSAETAFGPGKPLAKLLAVHAILERDEAKYKLINEHYFAQSDPSLTGQVLQLLLNGEDENHTRLDTIDAILQEETTLAAKASFDISTHFGLIWGNAITALAAWEAEEWNLADRCFNAAIELVKTNPIVNKLLSEYLVDKTRQANNAHILAVANHKPEDFPGDLDALDLHEAQLTLAGRFLPAAEMLPIMKIGQAVFSGHWNEDESPSQFIRNEKQAAQVLSVQLDPLKVQEIEQAFSNSEMVKFQSAIWHLHLDSEKTLMLAEDLLTRDPGHAAYYALQAFALENKSQSQAAAAMEQALKRAPQEPEWHAIAGMFYEKEGQYEDAGKHLELALRYRPRNPEYWQTLGNIKVKEKDYHAAKDYFAKAIDLFPDNAEALASLAQINQQLGDHKVALEALDKARHLQPDNPEFLEMAVSNHLAQQNFKVALSTAEEGLKRFANSQQLIEGKIAALIGLNRAADAQQVISAAKQMVPDPVPLELLSVQLAAGNNANLGYQQAKKLADSYPDSVSVLNLLAQYQYDLAQYQAAEQSLHRSLELEPENAETLTALGRIDRINGNLDQALAHLSKAVKLEPSLIEAYLEIGQTYQDRRDVAKALETYHRAIDMVSKDPRAYVQAAAAYRDSRDYRNAEQMLRLAAQLSPNDPSIRRQLAAMVAMNLVNNLQEAPKRR